MNYQISQLAAVLLVFLVAGVIISVCFFTPDNNKKTERKKPKEIRSKLENKTELLPPRTFAETPKTTIMVRKVLQHLSPNGDVLEEFPFDYIPGAGLKIGIHSRCDFVIQKSNQYISKFHAVLAEDRHGMFIRDEGSANGIYESNNTASRVGEIDVTFGKEFYLANEKFVLKVKDPFETRNSGTEQSNVTRLFY